MMYRYILWLLVLGMMTCATFAIDPVDDSSGRLGYSVTMSLTVVAFQFIVHSYIPEVDYLTILDKYNLFIFGFVLAITVQTAIFGVAKFEDEIIDHVFACIMSGFFILGNIVFIVMANLALKNEEAKVKAWEPYGTDFLTFTSNKDNKNRNNKENHDFKTIPTMSKDDPLSD